MFGVDAALRRVFPAFQVPVIAIIQERPSMLPCGLRNVNVPALLQNQTWWRVYETGFENAEKEERFLQLHCQLTALDTSGASQNRVD